jgi:SAM-dependent methyltransferase
MNDELLPASATTLPIPPYTMRQLVGRPDAADFDNPTGAKVFADLPPEISIFDFGSGSGRVARQLMQQKVLPAKYVGVDLHQGMVEWCQTNLTSIAPTFEFQHHDVENPGFNPGVDKPGVLPLPGVDQSFDLFFAHSVFTHLRESQVPHYLREARRLIKDTGVIRATWFLMDKAPFPMMQSFQNALYINEYDPTNAVLFDRGWFKSLIAELDLIISAVTPPAIRGYHWGIDLRPTGAADPVQLPVDQAPLGSHPPPVVTVDPWTVR